MNNKKYYFLIILFIIAVFIWMTIFQNNINLLEVNFFDVGQGDAIFIETPSQKQILIDGGPDNSILERLGNEMSFFDRTIDMVILTHPDSDHITGLLKVLEIFDVKQILVSGDEKDNIYYKIWQNIINKKNISLKLAQAGQKIILDKDIYLNILWPEQNNMQKNINNNSVVAHLVYNNAEFLLTGDIDKSIENKLINNNDNLESDVLKAAHHGSKYSSSQNFADKIKPKIFVISVGENRYGHPHEDVLERFNNKLIYRTDIDNNIKIITNGEILEIEK